MRGSEACSVCGSRSAISTCITCGRPYCSLHGEGDKCVICTASTCEICRESLSIGYCPSCGRLVCIECSIQIDPARRVCRECGLERYRIAYSELTATHAKRLSRIVYSLLKKRHPNGE